MDDLNLYRDKAEDDTQELAVVPIRPPRALRPALRTTLTSVAASAVGFALAAFLLSAPDTLPPPPPTERDRATPSTSAPPTSEAPEDNTGIGNRGNPTGILRPGDTGPPVTDLQIRLLRVPAVYTNGPVDGQYGTELTQAVARYQLWYGVQGDEKGVYGTNTRRSLESRTEPR